MAQGYTAIVLVSRRQIGYTLPWYSCPIYTSAGVPWAHFGYILMGFGVILEAKGAVPDACVQSICLRGSCPMPWYPPGVGL